MVKKIDALDKIIATDTNNLQESLKFEKTTMSEC
jgi:hypothetical protein